LGSIKPKITAFQGKNDSEVYLNWENMMEFIFDWHQYLKEKKVKLVVLNSLVILLFGGINLLQLGGVMKKDTLTHGRRWNQSWGRGLSSLAITIGKYIIGCNFSLKVLKVLMSILRRWK